MALNLSKAFLSLYLCTLVLFLSRNPGASELKKFDVTGFELCAFNLVVEPHTTKQHILTTDFVERFVILNQGAQTWTLRTVSNNNSAFINLPELCSINIIISIVGCSKITVHEILGTHLVNNPRSIVYLVKSDLCDSCRRAEGKGCHFQITQPITCEVLVIRVSTDALHVEQAVLMSFAYVTRPWILARNQHHNLLKIRQFFEPMRHDIYQPLVALFSHHTMDGAFFDACKHNKRCFV